MPIVNVRDIRVLENDSFSQTVTFTVFTDETATAPVTLAYFLQGESATEADGDFDERSGTVTIPAGSSSLALNVTVYGDTLIEGNETFSLVLLARQNASFANDAPALVATATIYDDDDGSADPAPGDGNLATPLAGPPSEADILPTLSVRDASLIEGDSGFSEPMRFLITLDRPATAAVTGSYYLDGVTASEAQGDFDERSGSFTIAAGEQSTWVTATTYVDNNIESDETIRLVLTNLNNAVFTGGAAAMEATGTIIDDDGGAPAAGGIGGFGTAVEEPASEAVLLPTVRVYDTAVIEGNSGFSDPARFLITLDRPAPAPVTILYTFNNGIATEGLGDYDQRSGTLTIPAGQQSTWIGTSVYVDSNIEGDEDFTLVLSGIRGGVFEGGAALLVATGTILDDDSGALTGPAGRADPGQGVEGPLGTGGLPIIDVLDVSIAEGNSSSDQVYLHVLLSEPAPTTITVQYRTADSTATQNQDYDDRSGTLQFLAGQQSSYISIPVYGDTNIESDETFTVRLSNPTGAVFSNGLPTLDATVLIRDNDGGGTAGTEPTGPDFEFIVATPGAGPGNDTIVGTATGDQLRGQAGNDRIFGSYGDDTLYGGGGADYLDGGSGADTMVGGTGNDFYIVNNAGDVIAGEIAFGAGGGIDTVRTFINNYVQPNNVELVRLGNITDTTNLSATGNDAPGTLVGNAGNNTLTGRGGNDQINGNNGNDVLIGNTGRDTLVGGAGSDTFVYTAYADSRAGIANRDVINGFTRTAGQDDTIDLSAMDANTRTFGVDDAFVFVGGRAFSGQAGELRTQGLGGANAVIIEGDHNGDRVADFQIFVNLTTYMTGSDIIL